MKPSRRRFLQVSLAGAGLLAVGGVGLSWQGTRMLAPTEPLRVLDARQYSILVAVADRVCPGGAGAPTARSLGVAGQIDRLLATLHPGVAQELGQVLSLLENAALGWVLDGNPRPFSASLPEVQDRVIEGWRTSRLSVRRQAIGALRALIASTYYADPRTYPSVGYPGPPPGLLVPDPSEASP